MKQQKQLWLSAAVLAAVLAIGTLTFTWYFKQAVPQNLVPAPTGITGRVLENLSDQSKKQLVDFLKAEPTIIGVSVVQASLVKNRRLTVFFKSDNPDFQAVWDEYLLNRAPSPPLFSPEEPAQNNRVANLFNGNFLCARFEDTISMKFWPKGAEYAPWTCTVPVPPGFDATGDFNGFINLYMTDEPSETEKRRLAKVAAEISQDIYRRDVESAPVK